IRFFGRREDRPSLMCLRLSVEQKTRLLEGEYGRDLLSSDGHCIQQCAYVGTTAPNIVAQVDQVVLHELVAGVGLSRSVFSELCEAVSLADPYSESSFSEDSSTSSGTLGGVIRSPLYLSFSIQGSGSCDDGTNAAMRSLAFSPALFCRAFVSLSDNMTGSEK